MNLKAKLLVLLMILILFNLGDVSANDNNFTADNFDLTTGQNTNERIPQK